MIEKSKFIRSYAAEVKLLEDLGSNLSSNFWMTESGLVFGRLALTL